MKRGFGSKTKADRTFKNRKSDFMTEESSHFTYERGQIIVTPNKDRNRMILEQNIVQSRNNELEILDKNGQEDNQLVSNFLNQDKPSSLIPTPEMQSNIEDQETQRMNKGESEIQDIRKEELKKRRFNKVHTFSYPSSGKRRHVEWREEAEDGRQIEEIQQRDFSSERNLLRRTTLTKRLSQTAIKKQSPIKKSQKLISSLIPAEAENSLIFSELRNKLLNKSELNSKYDNIQKMPSWLTESPEYQEIAHQHSKKRTVTQICRKTAGRRLTPQKRQVKEYLKHKVAFFAKFPGIQLQKIASKLYSQFYRAGSIIFKQGSIGKNMFIIVEGVVDVIIETSRVAQLKRNQIFGETALTQNAPRGATIRAAEHTECLVLKKEDYNSAIISVKRLEKLENEKFVHGLDLLSNWLQSKKSNFTFHIESRRYMAGEVIIEQGDQSKVFYIVKEGKLKVEMCLDLEMNNKYPINKQQWEVSTTTKRILFFLNYLQRGDHFGHQEMMEGGVPRKRRVSAVQDSEIIYVKQDIFEKFFKEERDRKKLNNPDALNVEKIKSLILQQISNRRASKRALLDASKLNYKLTQRSEMNSPTRSISLKRWLYDQGVPNILLNQNQTPPETIVEESKSKNTLKTIFRSQTSLSNSKLADKYDEFRRSVSPSKRISFLSPKDEGFSNTTLRIFKVRLTNQQETKIINDHQQFLYAEGAMSKTGDMNIRIVGSLKKKT